MMNQVIIVGRIVKIESAEKTVVTIACSRPFVFLNGREQAIVTTLINY